MKFFALKKIDKLLFKEFLPPFIMAYSIAMFVLMMQFLWLYIDDIAGKGVGLLILAELIYYMGLSMIPMALPIAMLLASVMVFGNLAEKHELPSFKSAGIPLMRVMRSSMVFAFVVMISSFLCSNHVIPYANLKLKSRLYDIKKQKPALYLESSVFNDDFQGYSIRVGSKDVDNRHIEDVMIDDDNSSNRNQFSFIRAKKGEMYVTEDDRYFVMYLQDGHQYQEAEPSTTANDFPFVRTKFSEWTKTFDLGEFDLNRTDEGLFKSYHAMLNTFQLREGIDSIQRGMTKLKSGVIKDVESKMHFFYYDAAADSTIVNVEAARKRLNLASDHKIYTDDTLSKSRAIAISENAVRIQEGAKKVLVPRDANRKFLIPQPYLDSLDQAESLLAMYSLEKRSIYVDNARNIIRSSKSMLYEYKHKLETERKRKERYTYQLHAKYGFAAICFIFLFIGAPMGALVRKGGFGYPLLVAIFFFMIFIILTKVFEKLSKNSSFDPSLAAWMPCLILFPIGLFLTIKAMNDSKLFNFDGVKELFRRIFPDKSETEAAAT